VILFTLYTERIKKTFLRGKLIQQMELAISGFDAITKTLIESVAERFVDGMVGE
jgi:hypothetical protein